MLHTALSAEHEGCFEEGGGLEQVGDASSMK